MDIMKENDTCFLCGNLEHHGGRILQFENIQIVSDIAPLNEGHSLIASVEHVIALSKLNADELIRLESIVLSLKEILIKAYKQNIVTFEHGMGDACEMPACGIDHCHLHLLPIPTNSKFFSQRFIEFLSQLELSNVKIAYLKHYHQLKSVEGMNYLFVEDVDGEKIVATVPDHFPAQILRRYVSSCLGSPYTYDWQLFADSHKAKKTTLELKDMLQTALHKSSLYNENFL